MPHGGNGKYYATPEEVEQGRLAARLMVVEEDLRAIEAGERHCSSSVRDQIAELGKAWLNELSGVRQLVSELSAKIDALAVKP